MAGDPIEGQILLLTVAKTSVPSTRLPDLVDLAQAELGPRLDDYRRQYECVAETEIEASGTAGPDAANSDRPVYGFLVEPDHWTDLGDEFDFDDREADALRRAHAEQLRRIGRHRGRSDELETALEIREAVLIARPTSTRSSVG